MSVKLGPRGVSPMLFRALAAHPLRWLAKARELRAAAALVHVGVSAKSAELRRWFREEPTPDEQRAFYATPDVHGQWTMLLHFMLENVIKGWAIAADPTLVRDEGALDGRLARRDHSLPELAERLGVTLSEERRAVLDYLQNAALNDGRYPCARIAEMHPSGSEASLDTVGRAAEELYRTCGEGLVRAVRAANPNHVWKHNGREYPLEAWIAHYVDGVALG